MLMLCALKSSCFYAFGASPSALGNALHLQATNMKPVIGQASLSQLSFVLTLLIDICSTVFQSSWMLWLDALVFSKPLTCLQGQARLLDKVDALSRAFLTNPLHMHLIHTPYHKVTIFVPQTSICACTW